MALKIDLCGKVALVTGASQGIGLATAETLAKAGANLCLTARNNSALEELAQKLRNNYGVEVQVTVGDIADPATVKEVIKTVHSTYKRLDILVNNAGQLNDGVIGMFSRKSIECTLNVNLVSMIDLTQQASRLMMRNKAGSIINTSSIMAIAGANGQFVYAASKGGVAAASRAAARELGGYGIRVNCIAPGYIDTNMIKELDESLHKERVQTISLKRPGTAQEVANLTAFLASDLSSYITGETILIDGAMAI
jgi:3-oxoacyl-[acyl-carrier protein] reductase